MNYKYLFALLLFLIMGLSTMAQRKFGLSKSELMNILLKEGDQEFMSIGKSSDGLNYLLYQHKERPRLMFVYYFNSNGICVSDGVIVPKLEYLDVISSLNKDYKLIGDDVWEDIDKKLRIRVVPVPGSDNILIQYNQ